MLLPFLSLLDPVIISGSASFPVSYQALFFIIYFYEPASIPLLRFLSFSDSIRANQADDTHIFTLSC